MLEFNPDYICGKYVDVAKQCIKIMENNSLMIPEVDKIISCINYLILNNKVRARCKMKLN